MSSTHRQSTSAHKYEIRVSKTRYCQIDACKCGATRSQRVWRDKTGIWYGPLRYQWPDGTTFERVYSS